MQPVFQSVIYTHFHRLIKKKMLLYVLLRVYLLSFLFGCYEFVWDVDHHVCITKSYLCLIFRAMLSDMLSCSTLECHSLTHLSSPIEDFFPNNSKWWKTAHRVLFPAFVAFKICSFPLIVRNIKTTLVLDVRWKNMDIFFSMCNSHYPSRSNIVFLQPESLSLVDNQYCGLSVKLHSCLP